MTSLHVGIVGPEDGWISVLKREGIPFREVLPPFKPAEHAVLILSSGASRDLVTAVRTYIHDGGSVLLPPAHAATLAGTSTSRTRVTALNPSADAAFRGVDIVDLHTTLDVPQRSNLLRTLDGRHTAFIGREGNGHILLLPFDVPRILEDPRSADRSFSSPARRLPFEHVSTVNKGALRMLVARAIEMLFHRRGLPFAHLWYYPDRAQTISAFRIDTDFGTREEIETLYRLLKKEEMPATWFVHVASQQGFLETFAAMTGHEVAVHCHHHKVFSRYEDAKADLDTALSILHTAGLDPVGQAAPYGRWTEASESAAQESGISYRSEFSLGYDDLPFRTRRGNGLVQIPIHPVGLGSMRRHRYTQGQAALYFERVVERHAARRLPVIFYHHPKDEGHDVLHAMFKSIRRLGVPHLTMRQLAEWWERRMQAVPEISYERGFVQVEIFQAPPGISTRIVNSHGKEAFIDGTGRLAVTSGMWTAAPSVTPDEHDMRARMFNVRIPLVRGLDAIVRTFKKREANG